jgi:hypothetical protein
MKDKKDKQCVVCGARARPRSETCDPVCRRAHATGRTRIGQLTVEMKREEEVSRLVEESEWSRARSMWEATMDDYYNQPYLIDTAASF